MAIRFEYGPPPSALGSLAYQSGVQQAQDRRRRELEALQVQAAQMRQQRQQAALNRQFDAWRTQYGHHSSMARAKEEFKWRDQSQQRQFAENKKMFELDQEARKRAARQSEIVALARQKRQYELANDNAAAGHARSQMSKWYDEQMEYYSPDGKTAAQKIYARHQKRRQEGKLTPDQLHQEELQMYQEINDLYHDPGMRSTKGQPGWSEIKVNSDGIYTETYTMPDGTTGTRFAPHPDGGIHRTARDLSALHDREDSKHTWIVDKGKPTERKMYNRATVELVASKDGSNQIKVTYTPTEIPDEHQVRRRKNTEIDAAFKKETEQYEAETGAMEMDDLGNESPVRETRTKVKGRNRRRQLIDKYGPPLTDGWRVEGGPNSNQITREIKEGTKEYEDKLVEYLRRDLKEEFGLDQDDDIDLGVEDEAEPQLKRGDPVQDQQPAPAAPAPVPQAPAGGPGMGPPPEPQPAGQENQLVKQAVEPEQQIEQNLGAIQKAGWNNPAVTAVQRVRQRLLENPQEFPPEKVREIKIRMAARTQAILMLMQDGFEPIAPINQDPAKVDQEVERLINPALPGLGGGPLGGQ